MINTNHPKQSSASGAQASEAFCVLSEHHTRVVHFLAQEAGLCVDGFTVEGKHPIVHVSHQGRMSSVRIPKGTDYYVRSTLRGEFVRVAQALKGLATYYCPTCRSTDITFDGQIQWDREKGAWVLNELLNSPWCGGCQDTIQEAKFGEVGNE